MIESVVVHFKLIKGIQNSATDDVKNYLTP